MQLLSTRNRVQDSSWKLEHWKIEKETTKFRGKFFCCCRYYNPSSRRGKRSHIRPHYRFQNKPWVTKGMLEERAGLGVWNEHIHTTIHKTDNQQTVIKHSTQYSIITYRKEPERVNIRLCNWITFADTKVSSVNRQKLTQYCKFKPFFFLPETIFSYTPFLRPLLTGTIHQNENISLEGRQDRALEKDITGKKE